jgi:heme/copper-type cytochrome/quinol oxidase subunit 2
MDETQQHEEYEEHTGVSIYWWVRQIILILIAGFYLVFGIQLLISAYKLNDPASFIFMILFSAALLVGFIYRLVATYRRSKKAPPQSHTL